MTTLRLAAIVGIALLLGVSGAPASGTLVEAKTAPDLTGTVSGDTSFHGRTAVTFGVSIKVGAVAAKGHLSFQEGETQLGRVRLSRGVAVFTLPKDLPVGKHTLTLAFEPSKATAASVDTGSWTYRITVKKTSASRAKTLKSAHCKAIQKLSVAKVGTVKSGTAPAKAEYRAYAKAAATDTTAKGKRIWRFLRDTGPGVRLGKLSSAEAYLKYTDVKPSKAQKYQTKALARCVG